MRLRPVIPVCCAGVTAGTRVDWPDVPREPAAWMGRAGPRRSANYELP